MTKYEYCNTHKSIGYYTSPNQLTIKGIRHGGIAVKGFEYGKTNYMYCISGDWLDDRPIKYHKLKIKINNKGDLFVTFYGRRLLLNDFLMF